MKIPEALRLAHELTDAQKLYPPYKEAAAELRRLHEENKAMSDTSSQIIADNARLHKANQELMHWLKYIQVQTHLGHIHDTASAAIAKGEQA